MAVKLKGLRIRNWIINRTVVAGKKLKGNKLEKISGGCHERLGTTSSGYRAGVRNIPLEQNPETIGNQASLGQYMDPRG
jgi:hypothetical protein